jgi:acyl-CoA ligase (AMP-forming) (exosortase A-associated)
MTAQLLHELALESATRVDASTALRFKGESLAYGALAQQIESFAAALCALGLERHDRVAIYLPKQFENVVAMLGATRAGCVFVPVNPVLKASQVQHILRDCNVRVLVTSPERVVGLHDVLDGCPDLRHLILVGDAAVQERRGLAVAVWRDVLGAGHAMRAHRVIDMDMAAILYTSGSTGRPKGVVLSHRNMVTGAKSVAQYLENRPDDRLLAVLPFSFDYGFSQVSTAFLVGASAVLLDHLFARDIVTLMARERITGLAGVPPLWSQLADLPWPAGAVEHLRYITNSGGSMPGAILQKLRRAMPRTQVFLMYGLTEAFRSTFLPPAEIDRRPGSIGKAIPNAEISVVRPDGTLCGPNEPGELVHRGSLVALGYWNDPEKTAERYKPAPGRPTGIMTPELAVWSGDTVRTDDDGFLYFIGRRDEMIKTSGYRVSPSEIEEIVFATGLVADAAAVGVAHPSLGQAVVLVAVPAPGKGADDGPLLEACRRDLPAFMLPAKIDWREELPRNPNGKYDRSRLATELRDLFTAAAV